GARDSRENDRDVVFAVFPWRGRQFLAGGLEVPARAGQGGPNAQDALVEGAGAALDKTIGIQGESGSRPEPDTGLPVAGGGYADGLACEHVDEPGGAVGHRQNGRKVAGGRDGA